MYRFLFILACIILLAACGAPETTTAPTAAPTEAAGTASDANDPCAASALQAYRLQYNGIIDRWGSAVLIAGQTKAPDLQAPIDSLQQIAGDLNTLKPPACAAQAHAETLAAMQMSIGGYQDLLAKKDVGSTLRTAIDQLAGATAKVAALPGTPVPAPTAAATATLVPTWTPMPTAAPTATPQPTATPEPRNGVIAGRTQMFDAPGSTTPVRTLAKDTAVLVFELQKGRLHIRVNGVDGWVSQGSVVIR
jgi:hypothetical protein